MIQRIGRTKYKIYAFDLESHNDPVSISRMETSMWLSCLIDENSKMTDIKSYQFNMDEVLDRLEELSTPTKRRKSNQTRECKNVCIYIYNLSFEWSFMLPYLLKRGFEFSETINKDSEMVFNSVSTKSVSSVWQVKMKFKKSDGYILLRDLSKIYSGGLGKVAKAFNLETQKGAINYRKYRLNKNYYPSAKEFEYIFKDCRIIIDILMKIQASGDREFWNVISMASYSMKLLVQDGWRKSRKPYKAFREEYPFLNQEETDFLRRSVGGGITYAPERFQFKDITQKILHIDAHQMHPTQMAKRFFPYGEGEYHTGKPEMMFSRINCCRIRISYSSVKLHSVIALIGIPCIADKEIVVWDFEIPTMKKCYNNLEIEYIDYYAYKMKKLPFRNYIESNYRKRLVAKANKDAFNTLRYKLLNNSSYGKFLEKPHNQIFKNTINILGFIDSVVEDKDEFSQEISSKYTYLPVGSCIPAYSRVMLIETALKFGWEKVCYFDTDSIFVLLDEYTERVWNEEVNQADELGGWALEEIIDRAQFTAPKRYKIEVDGVTTIKAGGINFNQYLLEKAIANGIDLEEAAVEYEEINIVNSNWKVQRAFRCKGGTLIDFQMKEMSVPKKYERVYHSNTGH